MAQKQPFLKRVRNSSLVEHPGADNVTGLSDIPKLWIYIIDVGDRGAFHVLKKTDCEERWRGWKRECRYK